jgi:hypothetical protein
VPNVYRHRCRSGEYRTRLTDITDESSVLRVLKNLLPENGVYGYTDPECDAGER